MFINPIIVLLFIIIIIVCHHVFAPNVFFFNTYTCHYLAITHVTRFLVVLDGSGYYSPLLHNKIHKNFVLFHQPTIFKNKGPPVPASRL